MYIRPLFILSLAAAAPASAQELEIPPVAYPQLPAAASEPADFVPPGWAVVTTDRGDLNGDGRADVVLLMQMRDAANVVAYPIGDRTEPFDTNPHMLAVAFAAPDGRYRLAASSRGLFVRPLRPYTGEDTLGEETVRLERGGLLISFGYLRGHASYRFRWQGGAFRLIGYESGGASGGCVETYSINYLTGRARETEGLISSDRTRVAWRRVIGEPPTLSEIDLETFAPDMWLTGEPLLCRPDDDE